MAGAEGAKLLGHHFPAGLGHAAAADPVALALLLHFVGEQTAADPRVVDIHQAPERALFGEGGSLLGVAVLLLAGVDEFPTEGVAVAGVVGAAGPDEVLRGLVVPRAGGASTVAVGYESLGEATRGGGGTDLRTGPRHGVSHPGRSDRIHIGRLL